MSRGHRTKPCEAEAIAAHIKGKCEHVQRLHDRYGLGCVYPAKHSVVFKDISIKPEFKKFIVRLCNNHFEMMLHDNLLIVEATNCCFGSDYDIRSTFRRNRL
jgi:hypothetical protein